MANFLKALFVTLLTVAPIAAKELLGAHWSWGWFGVYVLLSFVGYWKLIFRPDERFAAVRTPSLDLFFEQTFSDVRRLSGHRFPFRVKVYRPFPALGLGPWFSPLLVVAYTWSGNPTDPDHGKVWWSWSGIVGKVFWTGKAALFVKGNDLSAYGMSKRDQQDTEHLAAVLAIPLRRPAGKESVSNRVSAVLAIDAVHPAAAADIEGWYADMAEGRSTYLVEKAAWLSLYF